MQDRINYYIFLPLLLLAFLLESTFLAQLFSGWVIPDLVFILLLAASMLASSADFLYVALICGLLFDLFATSSFGIFSLSFILSLTLICQLKAKFLAEDSFFKVALLGAAGALSYNLIYLALASFVFTGSAFDPVSAGGKLGADMMAAALLTPGAMYLIHKEIS